MQTIRPWTAQDIPLIVRYFTNLEAPDLQRMGCDRQRIPSPAEYSQTLSAQLSAGDETTSASYLMWEWEGRSVGFSSIKNLSFGRRGEMHLHLCSPEFRGKGLGPRWFALSALAFAERFKLEEIICEPSAKNPAPNYMLRKIGFDLVGTRVGRSSEVSAEEQLNTWRIKPKTAQTFLNTEIVAADSEAELTRAFPVICELRGHLDLPRFLQLCKRAQQADSYQILMAVQKGEVVGAVGFRKLVDLVRGEHLYVDDLVTTEKCRSQGIGALLLRHVEVIARHMGGKTLRLAAVLSNAQGQKFYEREGWMARAIQFTKASEPTAKG